MMGKKAVIFDMDGVLIDSERWYFSVKKEMFKSEGIRPEHFTLAETAGLPENDGWALLFPDSKIEQTKYKEMFRKALFSSGIRFEEILNEGVAETLNWLHRTGYKVGLASAGPSAFLDAFISTCQFESYFDEVVSGESITRNKPDPMIYQQMLWRLSLSPSECVAIEDSRVGILAATAAKINTWALKPQGYKLDQNNADRIIDKVSDIKLILKSLE